MGELILNLGSFVQLSGSGFLNQLRNAVARSFDRVTFYALFFLFTTGLLPVVVVFPG